MNYQRPKLIASSTSEDREILPFGQWLVSRAKSLRAIPGAGVLLAAGSAAYGGAVHLGQLTEPKQFLPVASGVQCLVILGFVFLSRFLYVRGFATNTPSSPEVREAVVVEVGSPCGGADTEDMERLLGGAARALRHYQNYWMAVWLAWLLLYAVLTFMHLPGIVDDAELGAALKVGATFLNNCAALALLYCYLTLSRPEQLATPGTRGERQADWPVWVATLAMLTLVEAILVAVVSAEMKWPPDLYKPNPGQISGFFGWVSGISSAVVMSFYTRRLASRFMNCPTWVIVLLYVYAALQPGFGVLGKDNPWGTVLLLSFALILKTLLFLYMAWVYRYGWLLYYFVQVTQFRDSVSSKMRVFSRILE